MTLPGLAQAQEVGAVASEVIVTAQRRAERLEEVPISVTAVTPQALAAAGVTSTRELMMVTPGLRIESVGAFVQPTVRGVTNNQNTPTAESNVATYVDGVYQNTMTGAVFDLPDVRQVEVLKGPQGTLFGRNATGGAILINTVQPDLHELSGMASASYGRFSNAVVKGYVTAPIVEDRLAFSVTGFFEHMDGYKHNLLANRLHTGHLDSALLRGKLRFKPWEGADFTLAGLYSNRRDYTVVKNSSWRGNNLAQAFLPASRIASHAWEYSGDADPFAVTKQKSVSLRGEIEAGPGTLTTTTAYIHNWGVLTSDGDNSALPLSYLYIPYFNNSFQQELVYSTRQLGRAHAVAGVFYYRTNGGYRPLVINSYAQALYTRDKGEAYAGFGEVVVDVTDRLRVTGGIRYSHETQRGYGAAVIGSRTAPAALPKLGEATWDAWTPRASALYRLSERTNAYFAYSQGFKSGLFNTVSFQRTPVRPEKVRAYELGLKSRELPGLALDVAGFYYDYKDLQQPTIISAGTVLLQELRNAAVARIYGVEANAAWTVTPAFGLTGGVTWLHARYKRFPGAVINVPTGLGGNRAVAVDASGNVMIRSPTWSGNLTGRYVVETAYGPVDAAATVFYSSKIYFEIGNRVVQPAYALVNASIGWKPRGTQAEFRVWGKNLSDKAVLYGATIGATGDSVNYAPPRTYGVEVSYRF
jgi:iron complex outermembrane receptor protein